MTVEYVQEGQRYAGGILTERGAQEVNAHRARVGRGDKESVKERLMKAGTSHGNRLESQQINAIHSTPY